jgi:hypothetical protein
VRQRHRAVPRPAPHRSGLLISSRLVSSRLVSSRLVSSSHLISSRPPSLSPGAGGGADGVLGGHGPRWRLPQVHGTPRHQAAPACSTALHSRRRRRVTAPPPARPLSARSRPKRPIFSGRYRGGVAALKTPTSPHRTSPPHRPGRLSSENGAADLSVAPEVRPPPPPAPPPSAPARRRGGARTPYSGSQRGAVAAARRGTMRHAALRRR